MEEKHQFEIHIKEYARSKGADIIGIAPVERFTMAPKGYHPENILPDAQSVIVMGKYFPLGLIRSVSKAAMTHAMDTAFSSLDQSAYAVSVFLEDNGNAAVPVPADRPYFYFDKDRQEGRGDLSHKHAAVLAGLGSLGKNSLLLTPEFGNRVDLVSVITTMKLEGDPPFESKLCIKECDLCIKSCPGSAIGKNGAVDQKACRKHETIKTLRGFHLFACWECRKVCPVMGSKIMVNT
jgi:epoxyqueuosine reductase QueG